MKRSSSLIASLSLFASTAAAITACGGAGGTGGSAGSGGGSALSPEAQMAKFCADTVTPLCEAYFACCADPTSLATYGGSVAGCVMKETAECQGTITSEILPHIKAGDTSLDESRLAACVSTLKSMKPGGTSCTRPPDWVWGLDCRGAFRGKLAPGAACDPNLHDSGFIVCDHGDCVMGTCVAFLSHGADCANPNNRAGGCDYVDGEFCHFTGGQGLCTPIGQVGDPYCQDGVDPGFTCYSFTCDINYKCALPDTVTACHGT